MGIIKQLTPGEAQKIAAGEVVDRPANIVKELVENALDAGSTAVTIYLEDGGKKRIQIEDNGHGMSADDARLSIARHSTSKITSIDDLDRITSFGFRGEALASITAVSKTTLVTKTTTDQEAVKLTIDGGTIVHEEPCAWPGGTKICVEGLFYNVPARKKFLKSTATEMRVIAQVFHAIALAHPSCHFKVYNEGNLMYNCGPVSKPHERLRHLSSGLVDRDLLEITCLHEHQVVSGFISRQHITRYDRNHIFLFVNNRWIKHYKLTSALLKGYNNVLPAGKYPAAALFITLDPREVDINIHPRKEEVAFLHSHRVEKLVKDTVQKTLELALVSNIKAPQATRVTVKPARLDVIPAWQVKQPLESSPISFEMPQQATGLELFEDRSTVVAEPSITNNTALKSPQEFTDEPLMFTKTERSYRLIGQLASTYILIEQDQNLMLIDSHAAHERVLFEQFDTTNNVRQEPIGLLFPHIIELAQRDIEDMRPYFELLEHYGIIIECFGPRKVMISATPPGLQQLVYEDFLKTLLAEIHEHERLEKELITQKLSYKIQAMIACKAAVKAGDQLSIDKMHEIIDRLFVSANRLTCPHGRPTSWLIDHKDIEKKFKRRA